MRAREIGGTIDRQTRQLIEMCANYANGQAHIELIEQRLERLTTALRS